MFQQKMKPRPVCLILCLIQLQVVAAGDSQQVIAGHDKPLPEFGHFEEVAVGETKFVLHKQQWKDVFAVTWQWVPNAKLTRSETGKAVFSGVIHHFNVGRGANIALYWGDDESPPKLVAVTDREGEFSFAVPSGGGANKYFYVSGRATPSGAKNLPQKPIPFVDVNYMNLKLALNSPTARYTVTEQFAKLEQVDTDESTTSADSKAEGNE